MSVIKPAIHPEQIAYLAGANNYCWIYFRNGEKKLLAKPISYLESKLPNFVRVHKTILLNPAYVKRLDHPPSNKMAGKVQLDSGEVFPVSRRRWSQVNDSLQTRLTQVSSTVEVVNLPGVPDSPEVAQPHNVSTCSLFFITDDDEKAEQAKQIINIKWPDYQLYTNKKSTILADLLKQLPEREHPTLILLDARTKTMEHLHTLRHLKGDNRLGHIPVILLVSPTDQLIIDGYRSQANSVIPMPAEYVLFKQTIERVCRFWLNIVKLPKAEN